MRIHATLDHTKRRSIYFSDPEGNRLGAYFERLDWREIFARGRDDADHPFAFAEDSPERDPFGDCP